MWDCSFDKFMFSSPWSHPHATLGRTQTWQRRRWWRWRPQNNGSISSVLIAVLRRRTAWSWGSWRRSGLPRCPSSSLSSSGCPALSAGSPLLQVCPDHQGNWSVMLNKNYTTGYQICIDCDQSFKEIDWFWGTCSTNLWNFVNWIGLFHEDWL